MTLIAFKNGKLHADRLNLIDYGHGYKTVIRSSKLFNYGDHAIGVCGEFDPDSVHFKEFVRLMRIMAVVKAFKRWPFYSKLKEDTSQLLMVWFVMVSSEVSKYLMKSGIKNEVIFMVKGASMTYDREAGVPTYLQDRELPWFLGSGFQAAMIAHRAGLTVEEMYSVVSKVQPTVSREFDTIVMNELDEPPLNYIEDIYLQLTKMDKFIEPHEDLLKRACAGLVEDLSEQEMSLIFPNMGKE